MADRGDVAKTTVDTDGNVTITYRDGTREVRSPDGYISTNFPDGTSRMRTPDGVENTTYPNGMVVGKAPPAPLPPPTGRTMPDAAGDMAVYRDGKTIETTHVDGSIDIVSADGSWVHVPPPPQRPVPAAGETWTHTVTATDGTQLEIAPDGSRKVTSPHGDVEPTVWSSPYRPPAPPVVTYDPDGTRHEYTNDGTHTIIEKVGDQDIRTVIPAKPTSIRDTGERLDAQDRDQRRDGWENTGPDGSAQRPHRDGTIDIVHTDGTVVSLPGVAPAARPEGASGYIGKGVVDADGTIHRDLHDPQVRWSHDDRPEFPGAVTTYADGTNVFDDGKGDLIVTDAAGHKAPVPRGFNPWVAATIGIVLITAAGGIAISAGGDDGGSSLSGLEPAVSVFDTTVSSVGGESPICPTGGGRSLVLPCPDDVVETAPVATAPVVTAPVVTASVVTAPVVTTPDTVPPGTAPASVADFRGRWVLTSGLVDPTGLDLLWYAKDMTNVLVNPTVAEFILDADGKISSGSYTASLTGQSACGLETWTATFNDVDGFVDQSGLGGVSWSGPVDLHGTKCFTAPDATGNSANFWITGDTAVFCRNPMASPTTCQIGEPIAIFARSG